MTFNKWFPDRAEAPAPRFDATARAWLLRSAWWVSTAMLVVGYVLMFVLWDG